jgi:hypothetical protein
VHLDVRDTKAYWVDWSRPGEPPKYDKPGMAADEGAGEVTDETPAPGADSTSAPLPDHGLHQDDTSPSSLHMDDQGVSPTLPPGSPEPHPTVPSEEPTE